jgi:hypothetical protein
VEHSSAAVRTHRSRSVAPGLEILGLLPEAGVDADALVAHAEGLLADGATAILVGDDARGDGPAALLEAAGVPVRRASSARIVRHCVGDEKALARLLAQVEPLRARSDLSVATDAVAETVRFLAVLAVLDGRVGMPDYDLDDPHLKWHAKPGVRAIPNAPTIVTSPAARPAGGAA